MSCSALQKRAGEQRDFNQHHDICQKTVSKGAVNTVKIVSDSLHIQAAYRATDL